MSNGKAYRPRLRPEQVEKIKERHSKGESVMDLAEIYDRHHATISRVVRGESYAKKAAKPSLCKGCIQTDRAVENVRRAREFRGDVQCISADCDRWVEVSANIVRSRQGRVRCSECSGARS